MQSLQKDLHFRQKKQLSYQVWKQGLSSWKCRAPCPPYTCATKRHNELKDVELVSITTLGEVDFNLPDYRKSFFFNSLFVSANTSSVVNSDDGDYVPIFLSQTPQLFRKNILPVM